MLKKITVIVLDKFGTDVHTRAAFFATAFSYNGVKVKFIKSPKYGLLNVFFYSIIRFFKILFSSGILYVFNSGKGSTFIVRLKKMLGQEIFFDLWRPHPHFSSATKKGKFFLKSAKIITYSNKNIPVLLNKVYDEKLYKDKLIELQTGGNGLELFSSEYPPNSMQKSYGLPEFDIKDSFKKVIFYPGDFYNLDCLEEILISFSIIADRADDVIFILSGSGNRKRLRAVKDIAGKLNLKNKLVITGPLYPFDMKLWIEKADIIVDFLSDNVKDYFIERLYIREALNLEKPVVCTKGGELVLFDDYTYQVPCDSVEIVNSIVKVVVEGRDKRTQKAHDYIQENLDYKKITEKFLKDVS